MSECFNELEWLGPERIAIRWTRQALPTKGKNVVELLNQWFIEDAQTTNRVTQPQYGSPINIVLEIEYADLADYQAKIGEWMAQPDVESFFEQLHTLTVPGGTTEVWNRYP